jgi:hypothetical protein
LHWFTCILYVLKFLFSWFRILCRQQENCGDAVYRVSSVVSLLVSRVVWCLMFGLG